MVSWSGANQTTVYFRRFGPSATEA